MPWKDALKVAIPLLVIGVLWRPADRRLRAAAALAREASLVLGLYALWNYAGTLQLRHVGGAMSHGMSVWRLERDAWLPSEVSVQRLVIHHHHLLRALDLYYAWVHVPALVVFLVWLFLRHRDRYPTWRTSLAWLTGVCFLIQLAPVAPPRMFPELGFVDTANALGESVYPALGSPGPSQLGAMPSVHMAWAILIAWCALSVSSSPWRWLGMAHAVLTCLVVVATANHWWLDGIVALALLAVIRLATRGAHALAPALRLAPAGLRLRPSALIEGAPEGPARPWLGEQVDDRV